MASRGAESADSSITRAELRAILGLSGPIFITMAAYVVIEVAQVSQLGHYRTEALSAGQVATAWTDATKTFLTVGAVGTLCSQAYGAGQYELVGVWLQVALVVGLVVYIPVLALCLLAGPVLQGVFGFTGKLLADAHAYSMAMAGTLLPNMVWERVTSYLQSIQVVIPETIVAILGMCLYLPLGQMLIFGFGSWRGIGFLGAPIAMATTFVFMNVALYAYACRLKRYHVQTWTGWQCLKHVTTSRVRSYLRLYVPGVVQAASELWRMTLLNLWSGKLGITEAATQAAGFRIIYMVYVFVFAVSLATTTRVGKHLGAGMPRHARTAAVLGVTVAAIFTGSLGVAIAVFHRQFGFIFTTDEAVLAQLESISFLVASAQFFMTMADVFNPILNAQGRPTVAAVASGLTSWLLHVPLCWLFAFHMRRGIVGMWEGILVGYIGQGTLSGLFVLCSDWPRMAREAQARSEQKPASNSVAGDLNIPIEPTLGISLCEADQIATI